MKAQFKVSVKAIVEAEGETVKQVFERLGDLAACLGAAEKCGCCGSASIVPHVKRPQNYTYYSLLCQACGAELAFGQTREGERLFAKTDKGKGGWEVYQGGEKGYAAPVASGGRPRQVNEEVPY